MGHIDRDIITIKQLIGARGIVAILINYGFDLKFPVVSFDITLEKDGKLITERSFGSALSDEQKKLLSSAKAGDSVYIDRVKIKYNSEKLKSEFGYALPISLKVIDEK